MLHQHVARGLGVVGRRLWTAGVAPRPHLGTSARPQPGGTHVPKQQPWGGSSSGGGFFGGRGGSGGGRNVRVASGGSGGESSGRSGLWGWYLDMLDSHPMFTRCVTCGLLNGLGDVFCQLFVEQTPLNAQRLAKFSLLGMLYIGPILAVWYGFLGRTVTGILASVAWDQLVFAPVFIASIMAVMCTLDGKPNLVLAKLKQDLPEAVKVNWVLWVPFQYLNFKFVPLSLRTLAVNVVALLWNVYMSYSGHKHVEEEATSAPPAPPAPAPAGKAKAKK